MTEDAEADPELETDAPPAETEETEDAPAESDVTEEEGSSVESEAAGEAEPADSDETEEDPSGLQAGDFVRLEYTARTVEEGQLVDTTDEETAEEEDLQTEEMDFGPRIVVLGEGHLFDAVEQAIIGEDVGATGSVVIPAEDAFGEYDPDAVETVSADKIDEEDRYPGAHVHVDGQHGYINTIVGGRARVDFNHPLAGADIEYDYEVVEPVEDRTEQAAGLFDMFLDVEPELWIETDEVEREVPAEDEDEEPTTETEEVETLYVEATPALTMNQQWMFSKAQVADQVIDAIGVERIIVQEVLEGAPSMGMPGMMGAGGAGGADLESALEDADVDAEEIVEELEEP